MATRTITPVAQATNAALGVAAGSEGPKTLAEARSGFVHAAIGDQTSAKAYAAFCLAEFGAQFWVKDAAGYKAWDKERDTLRDELKGKGHSNPRQVIRRLLAEAMGTKAKGKGGLRELPERCEQDIGGCYTALKREEKAESGLSAAERKWLAGIGKLLAEMGVDLNKLLPKAKG